MTTKTNIYVGMVFQNKEVFKLHMSMFAVNRKFNFRIVRLAPECMVLKYTGIGCKWRVYAVRLKSSEMYEVRRAKLDHGCTVDERSRYDKKATATVIGEMMRGKFAGSGKGSRPIEMIQMMQGDHEVRISYWKAWRSREVALEYTKGSYGSSYMLIPKYLRRLVASNPGTIADLQTEQNEKFGHRFKYMFVAMNASIRGYDYMRKVVVVDGTHLRGKYAGCLLTASAQDGNYQIFPLAFAIVDGENDSSWEWFFRSLSKFVQNHEDVVFVSDRHSSIYHGLAKV